MTESFGIMIKRVNNAVQRYSELEAKKLGLTQVQMSIIDFVARQGPEHALYQTDVEHEFNIQKSSATALLQLMAKRDLIVRVPSVHDNRYKEIRLTAKSEAYATKIRAYYKEKEQEFRTIIGPDSALVLTGLNKLRLAIEHRIDDEIAKAETDQ